MYPFVSDIQLTKSYSGKSVRIQGFIQNVRIHKGLTFIDVKDDSGYCCYLSSRFVQCVFSQEAGDELYQEAISSRRQEVVDLQGCLQPKDDIGNDGNELEINPVDIFQFLGRNHYERTPVLNENSSFATRMAYRTLDLRSPKSMAPILYRNTMNKLTRRYFEANDFTEVETPTLIRPTPEGARDYLVVTRTPHHFYSLPQSPQIYKQLLMCSGLERYYQIARCYRDEDGKPDRQPEFTQIDFEMAFVKSTDVMNIAENFISSLFTEMKLELQPIKHMTYSDAMWKYGSDKPDLRYQNFATFNKSTYEEDLIVSFEVEPLLSNREVKGLAAEAFQNDKGYLKHLRITKKDGTRTFSYSIPSKFYLEYFRRLEPFGKLRSLLINEFVSIKALDQHEKLFSPLWITGFPMFDLSGGQIEPIHHPFTAPTLECYDILRSQIQETKIDRKVLHEVHANAYDLVINGVEVGGGSIRINDPVLQERVFSNVLKLSKEEKEGLKCLLTALKLGAPPHGGFAFGYDRLLSLMQNIPLEETIAFPKSKGGFDHLSGAPGYVDSETINDYGLIYS